MKIKNEKKLKKNIQEKQAELTACLTELDNIKNETEKCWKNIGDSKIELRAIDEGNNFLKLDNALDAIKVADKKSAQIKKLEEIIRFNLERIETLRDSDATLSIRLIGLRPPPREARSEFCVAYRDALKDTPEWKIVSEKIEFLKAMFSETFNSRIYMEDIIGDLDLYEQPNDNFRMGARAELLIK